ncbi:BTAD domain-containing putative transcriptional regulator [Actinoplanes sp. NPDC048796]|uniref:BTAD domain-containing putative transcriptional regulator n=1 Tax=Actinoplanes sp. NPDC048796 TaxID=3155640 RepID=UPI0033CCE5D1
MRALREGEPVDLGPAKQRAVLAVLLLHAGRPVPTHQIVDAVWGDDPPENGANVVQKYVAGLRRVLDPSRAPRTPGELLALTGSGYVLQIAGHSLDADEFLAALAASAASSSPSPSSPTAVLRAALGLWRGEALAGLSGAVFEAARVRLTDAKATAWERWAELSQDRDPALIPELTRLIGEFPLREGLRAQLMIALYRSGRQAEALATFREARSYLLDEFGIEPGELLQETHRRILRGEPLAPRSAGGTASTPDASSPLEPPAGGSAAPSPLGPPSAAPVQSGAVPPTVAPPGTVPPTAAPPGTVPPTAAPPGTVPATAAPLDAAQPGGMPHPSAPHGAVPPGVAPWVAASPRAAGQPGRGVGGVPDDRVPEGAQGFSPGVFPGGAGTGPPIPYLEVVFAAGVPLVTLSLGAWIYFVVAALRHHNRRLLIPAAVYFLAVLVAVIAMGVDPTPIEEPESLAENIGILTFLITIFASSVHGAVIAAHSATRTREWFLREQFRLFAALDPGRARHAGVGRPGVSRPYDDGGLIDINHVSVDDLVRHAELPPPVAASIVAGRPFRRPDELVQRRLLTAKAYQKLEPRLIAL